MAENLEQQQLDEAVNAPSSITTSVLKLGVTAALHPVEYAKVLIQLGHEPIAPRPTRTLFGRPAMALPSIFQYVSHIKKRDGFIGCYRGLTPRLCSIVVSGLVYEKVSQSIQFRGETEALERRKQLKSDNSQEETEEEEKETCELFLYRLLRDVTARAAAIVVSQPLHVATVRIMAQFVGREDHYDGLFASLGRIYEENGILGYFHGVIPRLTGELLTIVLASSATFVLSTYVVKDRESKGIIRAVMGFISSSLTYPYHVVSACMTVSGSKLAAGQPPNMPLYADWRDCWSHLSTNKQLKRGSSLLWRYYAGTASILIGHNAVAGSLSQFARPGPSA